MTNRFFSLLRYSFGNEDWRTEEQALQIQPTDQVLCITASGDRPLNLLMRNCAKMVCVDANPTQNNLLQLKIAAMQAFNYTDYLAFLGASPCKNRRQMLELLLPFMDEKVGGFWLSRKKMIAKGILYQGAVERLTNIVAKIFKLTRGKKVEKLFSMNHIEDQRKFLRDEWDSYLLRKVFNLMLNSFFSRMLIKDPGLVNYTSETKPGDYIYDRIHSSLETELAKKNPLLSLLLRGKVSSEAYAPYLTKAGTELIKPRLSLLEIHTTNILSYLDSIRGPTFDVFSLSDVPSYLSYEHFTRLLEGMVRTAKPGARFCLRQFLSCYDIPEHLRCYFVRDHSLEERLERIDNCFVYRFIVGTIASASLEHCVGEEKQLAKI